MRQSHSGQHQICRRSECRVFRKQSVEGEGGTFREYGLRSVVVAIEQAHDVAVNLMLSRGREGRPVGFISITRGKAGPKAFPTHLVARVCRNADGLRRVVDGGGGPSSAVVGGIGHILELILCHSRAYGQRDGVVVHKAFDGEVLVVWVVLDVGESGFRQEVNRS